MDNWILARQIEALNRHVNAFTMPVIESVMRRQTEQDGETVDIIDYYPAWVMYPGGMYGVEKVAHEYLDTDWQRERFVKFSGVAIDSIPVYDGAQALRRKPDRPHPKNVYVLPFTLLVVSQPKREDQAIAKKNLISAFVVGQEVAAFNRDLLGKSLIPFVAPGAPGATVAPSAPPAPPAPAVRKPPAPSKDDDKPAFWTRQALSAQESEGLYGFDYACAKLLYGDDPERGEDTIRVIREKLFGEFDLRLLSAYIEGIRMYVFLRKGGVEHQAAKSSALTAYEAIASKVPTAPVEAAKSDHAD